MRSLRLPRDLDEWFERRLRDQANRSASDILLQAVHGGLRLRPGYMQRHRCTMAALALSRDHAGYESYARALADSFGRLYVSHIEAWLLTDGIAVPPEASSLEEVVASLSP